MTTTAVALLAVRTYLDEVRKDYAAGIATEHTYRPALKRLLEALGEKLTATNEPKRIACGAPDYVITRADPSGPRILGYVEAKDIGVSLTETERTDQLKRYLGSLDNLILTDYLEFRWYIGGELRKTERLATPDAHRHLAWDAAAAERVSDLLVAMLTRKAADITSPDDLARRMARMAHMIRNVALETMRSADKPEAEQAQAAREELNDLCKTFKNALLPDLTDEAFADMFAQTLAYGLFAARYNHSGAQPFNRRDAALEIPRSNPFLRRLFAAIETPDQEDAPYIGFVDDLAQLLADTDMAAVLRDFGKRTKTEDPIVHFYEPFLQAYDPKLRELRGVYYTPEPVVSYITRSVDALLKRDFGLAEGLASGASANGHSVVLLDPAAGTGTFLSSVVNLIRERFRVANNAGAWPGYVRERLLPRLFGFELLMAPYAMAHLRLGMQLSGLDLPEGERARWAFTAGDQDRLGVYLTNTLEEAIKQSEHLFRGQFITDEANAAARIKRDAPVMVVLGNPPYSNFGQSNTGSWIREQLQEYKRGLNERKLNLDDDFIKFIRFGQWRIEQTGYGILAFITNNTYIDGITHRRMRQSLMETFDDIYVLNLHGSVKKREVCPDGSKDENVFDIQQGVAISLFVKRPLRTGDTKVHYADLWGLREHKYAELAEDDVTSTTWARIAPIPPYYFFAPKNFAGSEEYEPLPSTVDIFPHHNAGIQTKRDELVYQFTRQEMLDAMRDIQELARDNLAVKYNLPPDSPAWSVSNARADVLKGKGVEARVAYRPFDLRWTLYSGRMGLMARPRAPLMESALEPNKILLCVRNARRGNVDSFFVANTLVDKDAVSPFDNATFFPLYLYPDGAKPDLWGGSEAEAPATAPGGRRANLAPAFVREFGERLGLAWVADGRGDRQATFGPEDVFSYLYAIFHAPSYRERFAEFLRIDFPRVPLTRDPALFRALCGLGDRLVALHLLEASAARQPSYPSAGANRVEAVRYLEPDASQGRAGRVYINAEQYFEGVSPQVWEFHIGGYQVAEKWLKDRKGRTLSYADIEHYQRTIAALAETMALMEQVDEAIEEHGGWPLG